MNYKGLKIESEQLEIKFPCKYCKMSESYLEPSSYYFINPYTNEKSPKFESIKHLKRYIDHYEDGGEKWLEYVILLDEYDDKMSLLEELDFEARIINERIFALSYDFLVDVL